MIIAVMPIHELTKISERIVTISTLCEGLFGLSQLYIIIQANGCLVLMLEARIRAPSCRVGACK